MRAIGLLGSVEALAPALAPIAGSTVRSADTRYAQREAGSLSPWSRDSHAADDASIGAELTKATLDGATVQPVLGREAGHPVAQVVVASPRGSTRTLVLTYTEPVGTGGPHVVAQPMVRPMTVQVSDQSC